MLLLSFADTLKAERSCGRCFECGKPATWTHHVIPQSRGGLRTVPLCAGCHGLVHDLSGRTDDHSTLVRNALAAARAQGKPIGPPAVGDRPELAVRIRGMREGGLTLQAICDSLNAEGVPTARGGSMWRPSSVQAVLGHKRRPTRRKIANLPELGARRRTG
jgi:hypothetical protein